MNIPTLKKPTPQEYNDNTVELFEVFARVINKYGDTVSEPEVKEKARKAWEAVIDLMVAAQTVKF